MKYVRNLDDLKRYTFEFFDSFLPQTLSDKMVNYFLVNIGSKEQLLKETLEVIKNKPLNSSIVAEYGEVLLQLNDYRSVLKKFTELLLLSQSFVPLSAFLNRIFLQGVGDCKYRSMRREYTINERYFDRFIEIITFCNIEKNLYTPFFLAIFNCDANSPLNIFKEPLKEYLDIYLKDGDDDSFISGLLSSENSTGLNEYATTNTIKTLRTLVSEYVKGEITNSNLLKKALIKHKQEGFNIIEELFESDDEDVKYKATQLLVLLDEDRRVKDRLKYLYENTTSEKIKLYLKKECGFTSLEVFPSKESFESYVDNTIKLVQERLYGARLKRYYVKYNLDNTGLNGKILTFIMETFKSRDTDNQIYSLKEYFKFVDTDTLHNLSRVVYEVASYRNKLLNSKWALRLIALFGDNSLISDLLKNIQSWFFDKDKLSSCKYCIDLLSSCSREEIIDVVKVLLTMKPNNKQKKFLNAKLEDFSKHSKQNIEVVRDKLADSLGFNSDGTQILKLQNREIKAVINLNCTISLFNAKTGKPARLKNKETYNNEDVKLYIKNLEKKIKEQRKRLYTSFLEFRNYDTASFENCIVENNLLNFLSQKLLWGRYKKDKLIEICLLSNNKLEHIAGNIIVDNFEDYSIAILQSMDAISIRERLKSQFETLFNQFDMPVFEPEDLLQNANYVDSLCGVFCNAKLFVTRLGKLKFKINNLDSRRVFSTLVKENKDLNMLTCVEFDKVSLDNLDCSITLSKVRFYEQNKQVKSGKIYNLDKTEALAIKDINYRIVSNELAQIFLACKS